MDQNVIVFDTETTGLPLSWKAKMTDLNNWPRVIQLAWSVITPAGELVSETMLSTIEHCNLPRKKYPKLEELHHILFDELFDGAHDAMNDVRACAKCYVECVRLGLIIPVLL